MRIYFLVFFLAVFIGKTFGCFANCLNNKDALRLINQNCPTLPVSLRAVADYVTSELDERLSSEFVTGFLSMRFPDTFHIVLGKNNTDTRLRFRSLSVSTIPVASMFATPLQRKHFMGMMGYNGELVEIELAKLTICSQKCGSPFDELYNSFSVQVAAHIERALLSYALTDFLQRRSVVQSQLLNAHAYVWNYSELITGYNSTTSKPDPLECRMSTIEAYHSLQPMLGIETSACTLPGEIGHDAWEQRFGPTCLLPTEIDTYRRYLIIVALHIYIAYFLIIFVLAVWKILPNKSNVKNTTTDQFVAVAQKLTQVPASKYREWNLPSTVVDATDLRAFVSQIELPDLMHSVWTREVLLEFFAADPRTIRAFTNQMAMDNVLSVGTQTWLLDLTGNILAFLGAHPKRISFVFQSDPDLRNVATLHFVQLVDVVYFVYNSWLRISGEGGALRKIPAMIQTSEKNLRTVFLQPTPSRISLDLMNKCIGVHALHFEGLAQLHRFYAFFFYNPYDTVALRRLVDISLIATAWRLFTLFAGLGDIKVLHASDANFWLMKSPMIAFMLPLAIRAVVQFGYFIYTQLRVRRIIVTRWPISRVHECRQHAALYFETPVYGFMVLFFFLRIVIVITHIAVVNPVALFTLVFLVGTFLILIWRYLFNIQVRAVDILQVLYNTHAKRLSPDLLHKLGLRSSKKKKAAAAAAAAATATAANTGGVPPANATGNASVSSKHSHSSGKKHGKPSNKFAALISPQLERFSSTQQDSLSNAGGGSGGNGALAAAAASVPQTFQGRIWPPWEFVKVPPVVWKADRDGVYCFPPTFLPENHKVDSWLKDQTMEQPQQVGEHRFFVFRPRAVAVYTGNFVVRGSGIFEIEANFSMDLGQMTGEHIAIAWSDGVHSAGLVRAHGELILGVWSCKNVFRRENMDDEAPIDAAEASRSGERHYLIRRVIPAEEICAKASVMLRLQICRFLCASVSVKITQPQATYAERTMGDVQPFAEPFAHHEYSSDSVFLPGTTGEYFPAVFWTPVVRTRNNTRENVGGHHQPNQETQQQLGGSTSALLKKGYTGDIESQHSFASGQKNDLGSGRGGAGDSTPKPISTSGSRPWLAGTAQKEDFVPEFFVIDFEHLTAPIQQVPCDDDTPDPSLQQYVQPAPTDLVPDSPPKLVPTSDPSPAMLDSDDASSDDELETLNLDNDPSPMPTPPLTSVLDDAAASKDSDVVRSVLDEPNVPSREKGKDPANRVALTVLNQRWRRMSRLGLGVNVAPVPVSPIVSSSSLDGSYSWSNAISNKHGKSDQHQHSQHQHSQHQHSQHQHSQHQQLSRETAEYASEQPDRRQGAKTNVLQIERYVSMFFVNEVSKRLESTNRAHQMMELIKTGIFLFVLGILITVHHVFGRSNPGSDLAQMLVTVMGSLLLNYAHQHTTRQARSPTGILAAAEQAIADRVIAGHMTVVAVMTGERHRDIAKEQVFPYFFMVLTVAVALTVLSIFPMIVTILNKQTFMHWCSRESLRTIASGFYD